MTSTRIRWRCATSLEVRGGRPRERRHEEPRARMAAILERLCTDSGTLSPRLPA